MLRVGDETQSTTNNKQQYFRQIFMFEHKLFWKLPTADRYKDIGTTD